MKRENISKIVFILLSVSLLLPFSRVYLFGQVINLSAWINLILFSILLFFFLLLKRKSIFIITLFLCFIFYILLGLNYTNNLYSTFLHFFTYIPFIIAVLLLETNIRVDIKKVFYYFTICAAIGSISAFLIQFVFQDVFYIINYDKENVESQIEWGRISWVGSLVVFPLLTQIKFLNIYTKKEKIIIITSLIVIIVGLILTFNRTFLLAFALLIVYILLSDLSTFRFKTFIVVSLIILVASLALNNFTSIIPNIENLLNDRVIGFLKGQSDITSDLEARYLLYNQYIENILDHNFLGQGFGPPFSIHPEPRAWSDVTLISFLIPMGFLGVIFFIIFLIKIFNKIINNIKINQIKKLFIIVLLLSILISFNDDIWSHKNFPIYFVFIINSFQQKRVKMSNSKINYV